MLLLFTLGFDDDCGLDPLIRAEDIRIQHRITEVVLLSRFLTPYQVSTSGSWIQDSNDFNQPFPSGLTYSFGPTTTGTDGRVTINNGRGPAFWRVYVHSGACANQFIGLGLTKGAETKIECIQIGGILMPKFMAEPSVIDLTEPPGTMTIHGKGYSTTGGMPTVEYYDQEGALAEEGVVTAVALDGTWVSGPTPDLTDLAGGQYTLIVRNANGDAVGSAVVSVFTGAEPCTSDPYAVSQCPTWNYNICTCTNCGEPGAIGLECGGQ